MVLIKFKPHSFSWSGLLSQKFLPTIFKRKYQGNKLAFKNLCVLRVKEYSFSFPWEIYSLGGGEQIYAVSCPKNLASVLEQG